MSRYFSEAYRFEEDSVYLLHHLRRPNSLESTTRRLRRLMEKCIRSMYHEALLSLAHRRKEVSKDHWLSIGRPTIAKLRSDLKKYVAMIPEAAERNVWKP